MVMFGSRILALSHMAVKITMRPELTDSEAAVFNAMKRLSVTRETVTQSQIAYACGVSQPMVSKLLRRLVEKEYVAIETGPSGRTRNGAYRPVYLVTRGKDRKHKAENIRATA